MKQSLLHSFDLAIQEELTQHQGIYECECPHFNPKLPFRKQFRKELIAKIQELIPADATNQTWPLVYVSQGPGGFFFDFITLNQLIARGYSHITAVFVEELYQNNTAILQACLDLKEWFTELQDIHPVKPAVSLHFFCSNKEYVTACLQNPSLRGHVLCTVDPDDRTTIPNFDSLPFRKKYIRFCQQTMRKNSLICSLFAQNSQRNMIIGSLEQNNDFLLFFEHYYGNDNLYQNKKRRVFLNSQEVFLFEPLPYGVQIGNKSLSSPQLHALLIDEQ